MWNSNKQNEYPAPAPAQPATTYPAAFYGTHAPSGPIFIPIFQFAQCPVAITARKRTVEFIIAS